MDGESFVKNPHCHLEHPHPSRRTFLAAALAGCAATTIAMRGRAVAADGSKLIDTHHHFYPPPYQKAWADCAKSPTLAFSSPGPAIRISRRWTTTASRQAYCRLPRRPELGLTPARRPRTTWRDCAAISRPKWCAISPAAMVCSRRCRCLTSTLPSKRSNMRSIRSKPMASIYKRITEISGLAIRLTGRFSRS